MTDLSQSILLPYLFKRLKTDAPSVAIDCYHVRRRDMNIELASGNLDLALDIPLTPDPRIKQAPLFSHPQVCIIRKDHPSIGDELDIDSYLKLRHIQISSRRGGLGQVDLALGKMGKRRQIALRTQHYLAVSELVTRSELALTVPQIFADHLVTQLPVRYLQLPFSVPNLESHLYWHESTDQDRANRWLREVILELHEKLPWK